LRFNFSLQCYESPVKFGRLVRIAVQRNSPGLCPQLAEFRESGVDLPQIRGLDRQDPTVCIDFVVEPVNAMCRQKQYKWTFERHASVFDCENATTAACEHHLAEIGMSMGLDAPAPVTAPVREMFDVDKPG